MAAKFLVAFAFVAFISKGYAVSEIRLEDQVHQPHLSNPFIPKTISIAKSFLDSLVSCHVIFPNGVTYEAFPKNNIVSNYVRFDSAVEPFNSCGVGFINAPDSYDGVYELLSLVEKSSDKSLTLTRQKHHLSFYYSDSWQIPQ